MLGVSSAFARRSVLLRRVKSKRLRLYKKTKLKRIIFYAIGHNNNGAIKQNYYNGRARISYNVLNLPDKIRFMQGHSTQYSYDASGIKRRVIYQTVKSNLNIPLGTTNYVPCTADIQSTLTTDYCAGGHIIYENNVLKRILNPEGFVTKQSNGSNSYNYYAKDHLGNNMAVFSATSTAFMGPQQETNYYPFGLPHKAVLQPNDGIIPGMQPYKFGGKEYDEMFGLNQSDFEARYYSGIIPTFTTPDPLAEKYYSISPYAYCLNNPINMIDPDGRDPGDIFKTPIAAAKDWGNYYNGASILRQREFGSSIYTVKEGGKVVGYAYSVANIGGKDYVNSSTPPNLETIVAGIHSHGNYKEGYVNNEFSDPDKSYNDKYNINGYVATPNGTLQEYDSSTKESSVISTNLPSDPKDPDRKNNIDPTDVPFEKRTEATRVEQHKKPELMIPESQKANIKWAF